MFDLIGNDHYRIAMSHTSTGFALLGETEIEPFKETVYTSETLPDGTVITKDMNVKGRLFAKLTNQLKSSDKPSDIC